MVRSSVHVELASELEITKALTYLKLMDIPKARTYNIYTYQYMHMYVCKPNGGPYNRQ